MGDRVMDSGEKVRLVMCPNCENVLPELPDYSVYQCGGCGAVLHSSGKFKEDNGGAVGKLLESRSEHLAVPLGVLAAQDSEPGISLGLNQERSDGTAGDSRPGIVETNVRAGKGVCEDVHNASMSGISLDGEDCGLKFRAGGESELLKSKPVSGWQKCGDGVGSLKSGYNGSCAVTYTASKSFCDGPSDNNFAEGCSHTGLLGKQDVAGCGDRVRLMQRDREELLRKLDELKNELSLSYGGGPRREGVPVSGSTVRCDASENHNGHSPDSSFGLSKMLHLEHFNANGQSGGFPIFSQYPRALPCFSKSDVMHICVPALHNQNRSPGLCDLFSTQMGRSCPGHPQGLFNGQYLDASCDPFGPVPAGSIPYHPTCSCFHRVFNHVEAPSHSPPVACCMNRTDVSLSKCMRCLPNAGAFGCCCIAPRHAVPSCNSHLRSSHIQPPSKLNPTGFMHSQPQRVLSFGDGRRSLPIVGGAPFLACSSCFELLQIPVGVLLKAKDGGKFRCGACNAVISYGLVNRKLMLSTHAETKSVFADEGPSCEVMKGSCIQSRRYIPGVSSRFADEFDDLGFDYLSSERARAASSGCINLSVTNSLEMDSISPGLSIPGNGPAGLVNSGDTVQRAGNASHSPLPSGSPLHELFDHSRDHSSNRFGRGNRSSRSDYKKVLSSKAVVRQSSLHKASLPTGVEMSSHEPSGNSVPRDPGVVNREHDLPSGNKGESFLSNILKKSFKDLSWPGHGDERGLGKVFVNGHLIAERSLKKAEKSAGRILSGKFWYDFRAGFWGVMNGPCLGIVPPYIQEFNYPMMGNCAGGNTGVFVNGRELHHEDLDLLASRGLPLDRDRSYIIEISGRVYDEDTGEELDCLGKLAPTVEKVKRGFGMGAPDGAIT